MLFRSCVLELIRPSMLPMNLSLLIEVMKRTKKKEEKKPWTATKSKPGPKKKTKRNFVETVNTQQNTSRPRAV